MKLGFLIVSPGLFRLLLASAVLVNHLSTYQSGRGAVLLFFVLSGYWVYDLYLKSDSASPARVPIFYLNRMLRIYPLYLTVVFVVAAFRHHVPSTSELFLFGVASTPFPRLIGTEWSLDIEVQFYACLPLIAIARERLQTRYWVLLMALAALLGWWLESQGTVTLMKFLPLFALGMAMRQSRWVPSDRMAVASLVTFATVGAVLTWLWADHGAALNAFMKHFDSDAVAAICIAILLPYLAASIARRSSKYDKSLGDMSYPIYIVHYPVFLIGQYLFDWRSVFGVAALISATVLISLILWYAIDRPAERLRKSIVSNGNLARRLGQVPA